MDALTLGTFLSPILPIITVWNTGETGDISLRHQSTLLTILCERVFVTPPIHIFNFSQISFFSVSTFGKISDVIISWFPEKISLKQKKNASKQKVLRK